MGPSGSGKTSLLNALSQRLLHTNPGAKLFGKVEINTNTMKKGSYSNVGAYVQQDDSLYDVLTIKELLTFAAKIRTQLSDQEIDEKTNLIINELGLKECKD